MKNLDFKNKKVAVLGLGIEGIALVDFLVSTTARLTVLDKFNEFELLKNSTDPERVNLIIKNEKIEKRLGECYLDNLGQYDIIFRSPGLSYLNPRIQKAKDEGATISSQIKLFFDLCPCKIIGVTGTKGKGTTASLVFEILKSQYSEYSTQNKEKPQVYIAGNIGYPAISLLPELSENDIVILELSSFQLMDLKKSPYIAVVTNLSVDHLDYHKDIDEYRAAKESIIKYQREDDFAVLNSGSTFDHSLIEKIKSSKKYFSSSNSGDAIVLDGAVLLDPENRKIKICDKNNIELFGHHNLENIAAATLVADILNVPEETIKSVVTGFKGLPHRLEFVAEIHGVKFINDSFATNPAPTMAAIDSFSENKILILGGSSKGADFSELAQKIVSSNVKGVILIGDEANKIEQALISVSYSGKINKDFVDTEKLMGDALDLASSGDVIILSPACASFGLFRNYKDRGEKFKNAILKLLNKESGIINQA